jgi:hypothetical protein
MAFDTIATACPAGLQMLEPPWTASRTATDWRARLDGDAVDLARRAGRLFGQLAPRRRPRTAPCSPARAASMAALSASRLVCSAISRTSWVIVVIEVEESTKCSTESAICRTAPSA